MTKFYKCPAYLWINYWLLKKSTIEIGEDCKCNGSTIREWMMKFNIKRRDKIESIRIPEARNKISHSIKERFKREGHHRWKGGKIIASGGYIRVYKPNHPRASKDGYVYEHILNAEEILGRPLKYFSRNHTNNEIVHHIDFDKKNNKPENLFITINANHGKMKISSLIKPLLERGIIDFKKGRYKLK